MPLAPVGDLLAALRVVAIPMRVPFRGVTTREVALLEGPAGWGEFGPFLEYGPAEASRWLESAVESAWQAWPAARRDTVPVNATVPAVAPERVGEVLARFPGCTTAKVKVAERGQGPDSDAARVAAVREVLGPSGRIRIDANGAWSVVDAQSALARLARYDLEYAEQPCATVEELRDLRLALARNGIDVPIAADESIRKADDPLRVRDLGAADVVVVKVAPLGGVRRALEVVDACGLPAVVSSALDTSVGIAAGVALAAALPALEHACGLGTAALLEGDVVDPPLVPLHGALPVGRVAAAPELLARHTAPPDRVAWWRDRVVACHALMTGGRD
ncbi:o-succinylbenzoate synthase [Fodinibacter luteus]|uniref:o-succinylbenzoate synthase n=1 Tax=Fodinibacter luteus TaxID=552064 RepID=A0ABP8KPX3_9MICO